MKFTDLARGVAVLAGTAAVLLASSAFAGKTTNSSTTGQSVGIDVRTQGNLVVTGTDVYEFDPVGAGSAFWSTTVTGPTVTCSNYSRTYCGAAYQPATPSTPAADPPANRSAADLAEDDRCALWSGGSLAAAATWTQQVKQDLGSGSSKVTWTFTWTYTTAPSTAAVEQRGCWDGGCAYTLVQSDTSLARLHVNGWMAALSVLAKSGGFRKYSFSLRESDGSSRVTATYATVTDINGAVVASVPVETTLAENAPGAKPGDPGALDFVYEPATAVNLLATEPMAGDARGILNTDSFAGNNDGGADGSALARADMTPFFIELGEGVYNLEVGGTLKGNSSNATLNLSVSKTVQIRGVSQICLQ